MRPLLLLLLLLLRLPSASPWRTSARKKRRIERRAAHAEAKEIAESIADLRSAVAQKISESSPTDSNADDEEDIHSDNGPEKDEPWTKPLIAPAYHRELPSNHRLTGGKQLPRFVKPRQVSQLQRAAAAAGLSYHFALSTGHSGTTTLSNEDAFTQLGFGTSKCYFGFETLAQGWREFARHHPSRRSARRFVANYYIPKVTNLTLMAGKTCYVDFGHHTFFTHILSEMKKELGPAMTLLRLRRSRLDTASSYALKRKKDGPCGTRCLYCICPEEQWHCLKVSSSQWRRLSVFQRFLWMTDEVECRWRAFLDDDASPLQAASSFSLPSSTSSSSSLSPSSPSARNRSAARMELSWRESITPRDLARLAEHLGLPQLRKQLSTEVIRKKAHVNRREKSDLQDMTGHLQTEDEAYRKAMRFSEETLEMLSPVFF